MRPDKEKFYTINSNRMSKIREKIKNKELTPDSSISFINKTWGSKEPGSASYLIDWVKSEYDIKEECNDMKFKKLKLESIMAKDSCNDIVMDQALKDLEKTQKEKNERNQVKTINDITPNKNIIEKTKDAKQHGFKEMQPESGKIKTAGTEEIKLESLKEDMDSDTSFKVGNTTFYIKLYPENSGYIAKWWDNSDNGLGYNNQGFVELNKNAKKLSLHDKGEANPQDYISVISSYDRPVSGSIKKKIIDKVLSIKNLEEEKDFRIRYPEYKYDGSDYDLSEETVSQLYELINTYNFGSELESWTYYKAGQLDGINVVLKDGTMLKFVIVNNELYSI